MKIFCSLSVCGTFVLLLSACAKKSDPEPPQISKTQHLTASTWKVEDVGVDQNRDGVIEQSALGFFPCLRDNTITFQTNNTGTVDEGAEKCNTSGPQSSTINWNFTDNETNIQVNNSIFTLINGKSKIVVLDAASFALSKDTTVNGIPGPYIVKMKH